MEQSTILAPTNVRLHLNAGLTSLFYGNTAKAIPHFKQILELDPNEFAKTVSLVRGFTGRVSNSLDNTTIARQIIPDNPEMIYNFAFKHLDADDPLRKELLDKAELLLGDVSPTNTKGIAGMARIALGAGDIENAQEILSMAPPEKSNDPDIAGVRAAIGPEGCASAGCRILNSRQEIAITWVIVFVFPRSLALMV